MKLTVLIDNNTLIDRYFLGEPGLSFLIEDAEATVLFDAGYSDAFIKNAAAMNISLLDLDYVVLSHGHLDHTWGLEPLVRLYTEAAIEKLAFKRPVIVTHPLTLKTKIQEGIGEVGSMISEEKLARHFQITFSREPYWLNRKLVFLGEIERRNDFEARDSMGKLVPDNSALEEDDYLKEDSALVYKSSQGLVVITGCSHSGICNIIEYAKKVCGDNRVVDIIGGFHLLNPSPGLLRGTLDYLKKINPHAVHACHCTDLPSKTALSRVVSLKEVGVGLRLEYD